LSGIDKDKLQAILTAPEDLAVKNVKLEETFAELRDNQMPDDLDKSNILQDLDDLGS